MSGLRKLLGFLVLVLATAVVIPLTLAQPQGGLTPRAYLPVVMKGCNDYFDYFDDPNSGWPRGTIVLNSTQLGTWDYVNGEYDIFSNEAGAGYLLRPLAPAPGHENYVVSAEARFDTPTIDGLYGLIFGVKVQGNDVIEYYLFEVEPEVQQFRLVHFQPDSVIRTIVAYTPSAAILAGTGTNHLTAVRNSDQITLEVNGVALGTWTDNAITGPTYTGLGFRLRTNTPPATAHFDNFHLHICVPNSSQAAFSQARLTAMDDSVDAFGE